MVENNISRPGMAQAVKCGLRMGLNAIAFFIVCSVMCESLGDIQLSCNTVDRMLASEIKCTCRYTNGAGILWYKNNVYMADCYLKTEFCLWYNGHSFSVNSSEREFIIKTGGYNYSSCDVYTCRDLHQPEINASKRIAVHDSTSISALNISEPTTNHTSGFIGVTTECIYGASSEVTDLNIQWLVVTGSVEKSFNPVKTTLKSHKQSCQLCDGDKATQFLIGFNHTEEMECQAKEAKFRIILRHKGISYEPLNITTRNFYCVSAKMKLKRFQDKFLLLACVPALGIIGIIAYIYKCCSGTRPEGTFKSVVSEENTEKEMKLLTEVGRKQPDNMNDVVSEEYAENTLKLLTELEREQPDNLNDVCTSFVPHKDDKTKDNDSDEGYQSKSSTSSSEINQDAN